MKPTLKKHDDAIKSLDYEIARIDDEIRYSRKHEHEVLGDLEFTQDNIGRLLARRESLVVSRDALIEADK